ncbi:helix-turn-helix domain-containing protein [Chloroflexota bacterium]
MNEIPAVCNYNSQRLMLTITETAEILGASPSLLYSLAATNRLPFVLRLGKRYIVSKRLLDDYLAGEGIKGGL